MSGNGNEPSIGLQVFAAGLYGVSSLLIIFVNKITLTSYGFPSAYMLAFAQFVATLLLLLFLKAFSFIQFPGLSFKTMRAVFPLPLIFLLNSLSGLAGTKSLNIPMLTVLRRFSIVMTMVAEYYVLQVIPSRGVQLGVFLMVTGALVAAFGDLAFDLMGYTYVFANDFFTAANGVMSKQKMEEKELGMFGVMYYNTIFSLPLCAILLYLKYDTDLEPSLSFDGWSNTGFLVSFVLSAVMGFVLNYSIVFCTKTNSALTTTVTGSLKNIVSTYLGMLMGDYTFTASNFMGLNLSVVGSLVYSYVKFKEQKPRAPKGDLPTPVTHKEGQNVS